MVLTEQSQSILYVIMCNVHDDQMDVQVFAEPHLTKVFPDRVKLTDMTGDIFVLGTAFADTTMNTCWFLGLLPDVESTYGHPNDVPAGSGVFNYVTSAQFLFPSLLKCNMPVVDLPRSCQVRVSNENGSFTGEAYSILFIEDLAIEYIELPAVTINRAQLDPQPSIYIRRVNEYDPLIGLVDEVIVSVSPTPLGLLNNVWPVDMYTGYVDFEGLTIVGAWDVNYTVCYSLKYQSQTPYACHDVRTAECNEQMLYGVRHPSQINTCVCELGHHQANSSTCVPCIGAYRDSYNSSDCRLCDDPHKIVPLNISIPDSASYCTCKQSFVPRASDGLCVCAPNYEFDAVCV